jgi:putative transposase
VIAEYLEDLEAATSTKRACALLGASRATIYRRRRPPTPRPVPPRPEPANKLTEAERQHILAVLRSPEYCDLAPAQVWARLLDDGVYLCSISTMYRLLAIAGENRERRRQRTHPARTKPELIATAPNRVWSWDITKLQGPERGVHYELFVIIDIFSRYVIDWIVSPAETGELAKEFLEAAISRQGINRGQLAIHADRGTSMTSKPVAQLLVDLGVARSHSRPHVSNDNPLRSCLTGLDRFRFAPGVLPELTDRRVALGPAFAELDEAFLGLGFVDRRVDRSHVPSHGVPVLARHVAEAAADQVQYAGLYYGQRPGDVDRVGEALEPVADDDARIGHAAVLQLGEHVEPELGALRRRGRPDAEDVAAAVDGDTDGAVERPVGDLAVADLDHDGIDEDHRVDPVQLSQLLPRCLHRMTRRRWQGQLLALRVYRRIDMIGHAPVLPARPRLEPSLSEQARYTDDLTVPLLPAMTIRCGILLWSGGLQRAGRRSDSAC